MSSKNSKSVGPDALPIELLKRMIADGVIMQALVTFVNDVLEGRKVPSEGNRAIVALLLKALAPDGLSDLRPISLASHVAKAFVRMLVGRMARCLQPTGVMQCAAKGRQAADAFWAVKQVLHAFRQPADLQGSSAALYICIVAGWH